MEVNAFDLAAMERRIKEEVAKDEVSVVISASPCALLRAEAPVKSSVTISDKCQKVRYVSDIWMSCNVRKTPMERLD